MFEGIIIASYVITFIAYGLEIYNLFTYRDGKYVNVVWWGINGIASILALFYCMFNQSNDFMYRLMILFMIQICLCSICLTIAMYFNFKDSLIFYNIKEIPLTPQIQNYLDTTTIYPTTMKSNIIVTNPFKNKNNHSINDENV
jgi:hypothetical protein